MVLEHTVPRTPQQNGVTERANCTIDDKAHTNMKETDCPLNLWAECILTTVYQINCTPTSVNNGKTPYEAFFGKIPDISNLRVFYCNTYISVKKDEGAKKLGDCAKKVKFLGYPTDMHGWRFWDPIACRTVHSRSAFFIKTAIPATKNEFVSLDSLDDDTNITMTDSPAPTTPKSTPSSMEPTTDNSHDVPLEHDSDPTFLQTAPSPCHLHDQSTIKAPPRLEPSDYGPHGVLCSTIEAQLTALPKTSGLDPQHVTPMSNEIISMLTTAHDEGIRQHINTDIGIADMPCTSDALKGPEAALWNEAIKLELASIKKASVYELVDPSLHKINQIIGNKLILRRKWDEHGNISWYKARLTTHRDQQHDYIKSFAPVIKSASM